MIVSMGTPFLRAADVEATLVLCSLKLSIYTCFLHYCFYPSRNNTLTNRVMWFAIAKEKSSVVRASTYVITHNLQSEPKLVVALLAWSV